MIVPFTVGLLVTVYVGRRKKGTIHTPNPPHPILARTSSHVYANLDGDHAGLDGFDALPGDLKDHSVKAFVHAAGLGPHPGKLKRPTPKKTE